MNFDTIFGNHERTSLIALRLEDFGEVGIFNL
jgi:hypothetical protein